MSLYADLVAAGVPTDSHESDLYFPATQKALAILHKYPLKRNNATRFRHAVTGEPWIDVPFAYEPFWDKVAKRAQ